MTTLRAETRDAEGSKNLKKLRAEGKMPAVFYGKKQAATPISIDLRQFSKVWKEAGESSVITIERPEGSVDALIKEVDIDPVTGILRHADFYVFEKGQTVELRVPIEFEGESKAVKEQGAIVVKVLHELEISAEPRNLPHEIVIDLATLENLEDQITASDVKLPPGVTLIQNPEDVIVLVTMPKEEVEEEAPVDLESIEVEAKGKEAKEGEEGEASEKKEE